MFKNILSSLVINILKWFNDFQKPMMPKTVFRWLYTGTLNILKTKFIDETVIIKTEF